MTVQADGIPHPSGVFKGLAQAPLHFQNMVAELVDNAISAKSERFAIQVDISPAPEGGDLYMLRVWDNGPGVTLANLRNVVFKLGFPPTGTSHLNEHGFGLKNVLAKAEQLTNQEWFLRTRDIEILRAGRFHECKRPLAFNQPIEEKPASAWPSWGPRETGAIIELCLPLSYLQTVAAGRRGALPRDLSRVMNYLREHLGVFYRGYLEGGVRAKGAILTSLSFGTPDPVESVHPDYKSKDTVRCQPILLGGQKVTIEGEIGLVDKNSPKTKSKLFYYRHAPESQGVDIRIGDRVVAAKLISEIWERDRHPSLNGVAGEFRLPGTRGIAPPTLNNKTSLDFDSVTWQAIASAIRQEVPDEDVPHGGGKSEDDLRDELYVHIVGLKKPSHIVEKEYDCGHGVYVDIFWDQRSTGGSVEIYEVKKGKAQVLDVYQLVMYWDALVDTGVQPTEGHLVSDGQTSGISQFIRLIKSRKDTNGVAYNLVTEDWSKHGISP